MSAKTFALALLAAAALLTWLVWPRDESASPARGIFDASAGASQPLELPAGPPVEGSRAISAEIRAPAPAREPAAEDARAEPRGGWWFVGRLLGLEPGQGADAELRISRPGVAGESKNHARGDGSFEIDVSHLFAPQARTITLNDGSSISIPSALPEGTPQIEVYVSHPLCIAAREVVHDDWIPRTHESGARIEIRRDIALRRACVAAGRVRVPDDWTVEDVRVRFERAGLGAGTLEDEQHCDGEGRYRLKTDVAGEMLVVARLDGLLPAAARCRLETGRVLELPTLVLEEGACEISGFVSLPESVPLAGLRVGALRRGASAGAPLGSNDFAIDERNRGTFSELRGGCPVSWQNADVRHDGTLRLSGLEPGDWELEIHGLRASALMPLREPLVVRAPASGVVVGDERCLLTAELTDARGPVEQVLVNWSDGERHQSSLTDRDGRAAVVGDVSRDYSLTAFRDGVAESTIALPAAGRPRDSVTLIRLGDPPTPATLVLRLPAGAKPEASITVTAIPSAFDGRQARRLECRLESGLYRIPDLAPGSYEIEVDPSEQQIPVAFYGAFLRKERFHASLAPNETLEHVLAWQTGGRVRIDVEGRVPFESWASCTLIGPGGEESRPRVVAARFGESFGEFRAVDGALALHLSNAFEDCLPPGRYELRAEAEGYSIETVRFEVKDVALVTVKLKARER